MVSLGHKAPKVHKFMDGNQSEVMRYENNPGLEQNMIHTEEGHSFILDEKIGDTIKVEVLPINTPGHMSDHLCFLMKETRIN